MSKNPVCELYGIRYPLVMGGITPKPELGAAVSNAGGLGCIEGIAPLDQMREQIRTFRKLSDKPFSINFPLAMGNPEQVQERAKIVIEEKVSAVITSAGSPKILTGMLKEAGVIVAHVVAGISHARKAADAGVGAAGGLLGDGNRDSLRRASSGIAAGGHHDLAGGAPDVQRRIRNPIDVRSLGHFSLAVKVGVAAGLGVDLERDDRP